MRGTSGYGGRALPVNGGRVKPYYQTPDGRVRLYHGDCREIMPVVCPPEPRVLNLSDPQYGVSERTRRRENGRGATPGAVGAGRYKSRDWKPIHEDDRPFDPAWLLAYQIGRAHV